MIKFEQTSETYGDCMADYNVILDRQYTVREFRNWVLERKDEWGYFSFFDPNIPWYERKKYEYRYGRFVTDDLPDDMMDKVIDRITAYGGWSYMDYLIYSK